MSHDGKELVRMGRGDEGMLDLGCLLNITVGVHMC